MHFAQEKKHETRYAGNCETLCSPSRARGDCRDLYDKLMHPMLEGSVKQLLTEEFGDDTFYITILELISNVQKLKSLASVPHSMVKTYISLSKSICTMRSRCK